MQTSVPQNGGYMVAAYVIVSLIVLCYAWSLVRRIHRELREP
jgi:hypothetical protein